MSVEDSLTVIAALLATWIFWPIIFLGVLVFGFVAWLSWEWAVSYVRQWRKPRKGSTKEKRS